MPVKKISLMLLLSASMSYAAVSEPLLKNKLDFSKLDKEKVSLGKKLFFDPRLSQDGTVSCNSCHNLMGNGSDQRPNSVGVGGQHGDRKAPTVWNVALMSAFFWDGRAKSLEEQAVGPITNPIEMGMPNAKAVEDRLKKIPGYVEQFSKVYKGKESITLANIGDAIAEFERTLLTPDSAFDRYMAGDKKDLSDSAKRGYDLVQSVGCTSCHQGVNFSGPKLPDGTPFLMKFPTYAGTDYEKKYDFLADTGRHRVTKDAGDKHLWRVPTWRNIALLAPYMHNGSVKTLDEAVRVMAKTQLGKDLKQQEVGDIVSFLENLTGEKPKLDWPELPQTVGASFRNL
ncbi:MAG: cytochrome-c peroxidase [Oligoflexales bacterium]|nr:cytochrome-c peroxidase [Oligoflexales bacterium]